MTELSSLLSRVHILPHLPACLDSGEYCHLVGGAPRDFLLGRTTSDFDFTTPGDPTRLAKRFAARINGRWFMMDHARKQCRVVLKSGGEVITYDFAPFRSDSLDDDLRLRDFTINALAVDLSRSTGPLQIYDPLNARNDLDKSILRACSDEVFQSDPLRVLRGVRLASSLRLQIEERTVTLMHAASTELGRVSAERVRSELSLIFSADPLTPVLKLMESLGVLPVVFGVAVEESSFSEGIRRVDYVAQRHRIHRDEFPVSLDEIETDNELSPSVVIMLAAFLSGCCALDHNPLLLKHLRFSNNSSKLIHSLVGLSASVSDELTALTVTGRGRALWVSRLGPAPCLSLLYLLCQIDNPEALLGRVHSAVVDYLKYVRDGRVPDLVDGAWIRSELGVNQGPLIGRYLHHLRQAEIEGRVHTLDEAHKLLKSLAQKMIDKENDPS